MVSSLAHTLNARTLPTVAVILSVVLSLIAGIHYYLWARLVRDPQWPPAVQLALGALLVLLALAMPATMILRRAMPRALAAPVAWVVFTWMGLSFLTFLTVAVSDLVGAIVRLAVGVDPSHAQPVARGVAALVVVLALSAALLALRGGLRAIDVKAVTITLPKLPEAARGMRVVQVSDIHVGPTIGRAFIDDMVARINALKPDVVAITGDLVDGSVADLGAHVQGLADLRATHGVFFVTGNHEYYSGADEWIALLTSLRVRVLRNERVTVTHNGAPIDIAGVDDWSASRFGKGHGADLPRALKDRDVTRPLILLAHQPKQVTAAAEGDVCLVLSGHTHGGQLWPFTLMVSLDQPYVTGLYRKGPTQVYVSEGTGYWGPPMRLGTRAEITDITLA